MISEELLSEVLDIPPFPNHDDQFIVDDNCIILSWGGEIHDEINIYELAHKCKEWAMENYSIMIVSSFHASGEGIASIAGSLRKDFISNEHKNSEPEVIFKACEYILEEY